MKERTEREKERQQNQNSDNTGMEQGGNLGQKEAGQEKKSDAEIKRMREGHKSHKNRE